MEAMLVKHDRLAGTGQLPRRASVTDTLVAVLQPAGDNLRRKIGVLRRHCAEVVTSRPARTK
jgi:hypothetical protein